jgi:hypothetical protein
MAERFARGFHFLQFFFAWRKNCSPAWVSTTFLPNLSKRRHPMSLSSAFIEWLTPDWVRCSSRAACVKLPVRASAQNARTCRLSRGVLMYESGSSFPSELRAAIFAPKAADGTRMA